MLAEVEGKCSLEAMKAEEDATVEIYGTFIALFSENKSIIYGKGRFYIGIKGFSNENVLFLVSSSRWKPSSHSLLVSRKNFHRVTLFSTIPSMPSANLRFVIVHCLYELLLAFVICSPRVSSSNTHNIWVFGINYLSMFKKDVKHRLREDVYLPNTNYAVTIKAENKLTMVNSNSFFKNFTISVYFI